MKKHGTEGFSKEQLKGIVGTSKEFVSWCKTAKLDTQIETHFWSNEARSYSSKYIGKGCNKPNVVINFFNYLIRELFENGYEDRLNGRINLAQIISVEGGKILVYLGDVFIMLDAKYKVIDGEKYIDDEYEFVSQLKGVINFVSEIFPCPIHAIEYWCNDVLEDCRDFSETTDSWLIGFSEAAVANDVLLVEDEDVLGEYMVAFIEK